LGDFVPVFVGVVEPVVLAPDFLGDLGMSVEEAVRRCICGNVAWRSLADIAVVVAGDLGLDDQALVSSWVEKVDIRRDSGRGRQFANGTK
jgi:hypothetical protein